MANVINNGKLYKVQRIEDKPTSALEQLRSERHGEEINKGLLEMSHRWTVNSVMAQKDKIFSQLSLQNIRIMFYIPINSLK